MTPLWTLDELSMIGELHPMTDNPPITGVAIDSRQVTSGDLFVALSGDPGPRFHGGSDNPRDGHEFIPSAVAAGAAAILLSNPVDDLQVPFVRVPDTLDGLWALAGVARARTQAKVVAITGSAGKTTAKSWLSDCLAASCKVHSSVGSFNNHWGVPLSMARMPGDTELAVFEIGTNHPGEIGPLSELVLPDVSLLLNVLPAHIGNFDSIEALRAEKRAIANGLSESGVFVLPHELKTGAANEITFGLAAEADANASYEVTSSGLEVSASICGASVEYQLSDGGQHRVLTSLAILTVAAQLGFDLDLTANHLKQVASPKGRGNKLHINDITLIDDSYNANPVSMVYAIEGMAQQGRKIALLGEILELGDQADGYHAQVAESFALLDRVITVGAGFVNHPGDEHYDTAGEIDLDKLVDGLSAGDQILVKGSNKVFWQHQFVDRLAEKLKARSS